MFQLEVQNSRIKYPLYFQEDLYISTIKFETVIILDTESNKFDKRLRLNIMLCKN